MGVTQHVSGVDNVRAIVNLGLARGNVGPAGRRAHAHPRSLRRAGRSRDGLYATRSRAGARSPRERRPISRAVGIRRPGTPGLTAAAMVDAARHGDLDVLWSSGGNFLDVLPAPDVTATAFGARRCASTRTSSYAPDARRSRRGRRAAARGDALRTGGRGNVDHDGAPGRVQPRDPGPRVGEARSEWQIFADIARRVHPERAALFGCESARRDPGRDRARRTRVRRASRTCTTTGDAIQVGGERLCEGGVFPTPGGRAQFAVVVPEVHDIPDGHSCCRPGAVSSSTPWCGTRRSADGRGARRAVPRTSRCRRVRRARRRGGARTFAVRRDARPCAPRADPARQRAGVLPGGESLLAPARREPISGVPDYNAVVEVVRNRSMTVEPDALLELFVDVRPRRCVPSR